MIYIFKNNFPLSNGSIIKKGDAVFLDDPDAVDEVSEAVKSDQAKPKTKDKRIATPADFK